MSLFCHRIRRKVLAVGMNLAVQVAAAEGGVLMHAAPVPTAPAALHEEARNSAGEPKARPRRRPRISRQLRDASAGLGLARLQLRVGLTQDAEATLDRLHQDIQSLRRRLEKRGGRGQHAARPAGVPSIRTRPGRLAAAPAGQAPAGQLP